MVSGHKVQFGVDTSANPTLIQGRILAQDGINRAFRGGLNDTRPPFQLLTLFFDTDAHRTLFETNRLTSLYGYNAVPPYTRSHVIATTGKYVWAGHFAGGNCYMSLIYDQLDETLMQQYPVQGETVLIINNGKTDPIFWNGQTTNMRFCKDSSFAKAPMPIGNAAIYCHGRIFIAREDGTVYAGDHLYSQGITASDEVLMSFYESTYPVSGDGFTAPAEWGPLTGLKVVDRNPSTNGHGEIIVYHRNGAYAIDPIEDRSKWTAQQIQQTVFVGRGGASPFSIVSANNDHFFRCSDKSVASLKITIAERTNQFADRPISTEVQRYLDYDNNENLIYAMSGTEHGRVFFSVNHEFEKVNGVVHRFALGLVSLDLNRGSNSVTDNISWDGMWTGPRFTGIAEIGIGNAKRCVFSSFDSDGKNRLYLLSPFRGDDITGAGQRKIKSMYSFGAIFDGLTPDAVDVKVTTIKNNVVFYSDCVGTAVVAAAYSPGFSHNWFSMYEGRQIGLNPKEDNFLFDVGSNAFKGDSACSVTEESGNRAVSSYVFALRMAIEGSVIIQANMLTGDQIAMSTSFEKACPREAGYAIDAYDNFTYTF